MKNIILCADDYGLTTPICDGILSLVANKRLSAVSCMTNFPSWEKRSKELLIHKDKIDIGLHFNLTEGNLFTELSSLQTNAQNKEHKTTLFDIITRAYTHRLIQKEIEEEFTKQLERFVTCAGQPPDFIDGHQHIHQLPVIRDAILSVYKKVFLEDSPYIRIPSDNLFKSITNFIAFPKSQIIMLLGSLALRRKLQQNNIPFNKTFAGIYNFQYSKQYRKYFLSFLRKIEKEGIIMCHPAMAGRHEEIKSDVIAQARHNEYHYLISEAFVNDCQRDQIKLSKRISK